MCSEVGSRVHPKVPSSEELGEMGCDKDVCGVCSLYAWTQMLGEWMPHEGKCTANAKAGVVRADTPKCNYFYVGGR